jgi:serine/threonine protein kinase
MAAKARVLIAELGTSQNMSDERKPTRTTVRSAEPELVLKSGNVAPKCNICTLGLVLYEFLAGKPVFDFKRVSRRRDEKKGT